MRRKDWLHEIKEQTEKWASPTNLKRKRKKSVPLGGTPPNATTMTAMTMPRGSGCLLTYPLRHFANAESASSLFCAAWV